MCVLGQGMFGKRVPHTTSTTLSTPTNECLTALLDFNLDFNLVYYELE